MGNLKVYIIVGLIIIAVLLAVFFIGKYKGKQYTPDKVALPADMQGLNVPANWSPATTTDSLYNDLYTVVGFHSSQPYQDALELSNSQLVAVHNDWNKRYFSKDKQTLSQAIQADYSIWNSAWSATSNALVQKLRNLGL